MVHADILIWDSESCESDSADFIPRLQQVRQAPFSNIVIISRSPSKIPPSFEDFAISFPITIRFGPNAIHDALVDVVALYTQSKGKCGFTVVSNSQPIWIALFKRIEPKSVTFIASNDPKSLFDFSWLPPTVPVRVLSWPTLTAVDGGDDDELELPLSAIEGQGFLSDEEHAEEEDHPSPRRQGPPIQPLKDVEIHEIDLRSPISSSQVPETDGETPKRGGKVHSDQTFQVPAKFKALVEVMRSMGKIMVSIPDLEAQLKSWAAKTGEPIENPTAYIGRAVEAQLLTIDRAINYARFRNRALTTANVVYV
jgi:hypothetical protein